jgi:hypothetical protein
MGRPAIRSRRESGERRGDGGSHGERWFDYEVEP